MQKPAGPADGKGSGPEPLDPALARVVRETGASVAMIYLMPPGERTLRLASVTGVSHEIAAPWARVALSDPIPVAHCVREQRMIWLGSQQEVAQTYPRLALVLPYDFVLAALPLSSEATRWGGVVLLWPGSHPPALTAHERDAVHAFSRRLCLELEDAVDAGSPLSAGALPRVLAHPRGRVPGPMEALAAAEFIDRLPGGCCALDPEGRIVFVSPDAAELVGADGKSLLGLLPWQALPWLDDPVFEDRYRAAAVSHRPTSFIALRPPDHWLSFQLYPDASGISVRITSAGTDPVPATPAPRSPAPSASLGRAASLYHLMHLAATLTEAVAVQDVVTQAADQLVPAFGAQALALMTEEEGRLRILGYRGYDAELIARFDGTPMSAGTAAVRILETGVPSFFASFEELKRAYPSATTMDGMSAWAMLPLIASGDIIGSLVLAYDRPHPFTAQDRTVLVSLAGLIGQAYDRARLYDATHQLAHSLQAALLPHALPGIPGLDVAARYLPAARHVAIGGDFYDLIRIDDTTVAATIGDVQGHNVNAAALMGQVRAAVHASAGAPPGDVLARTNRLLTDLNPGLFASCLYAHLDLANERAQLATAGHPPPVLSCPDGRTHVLDLSPGLLLGIDPCAGYPDTEIELPVGAVLALYTDGLVESPGIDLDDATACLAEVVGASRGLTMEALADTLVAYAKRSAAGNDDIALLLVNPRRSCV
ncbi:SpoIIE family protein phosphatase [Streptomyces sp. NPDC058231]|uniref:SpoIIE family protein phosphatase n=1 Tax=Streptomyces sp. NPDC058231 TaxID=3346392 RepID=UPI0036E2FA19